MAILTALAGTARLPAATAAAAAALALGAAKKAAAAKAKEKGGGYSAAVQGGGPAAAGTPAATGAPEWLTSSEGRMKGDTAASAAESPAEQYARALRRMSYNRYRQSAKTAAATADRQKKEVLARYYADSREAAGRAALADAELSEYMAERGLARSGAAVLGRLAGLNALNRTLGELRNKRDERLAGLAEDYAAQVDSYAAKEDDERRANELAAAKALLDDYYSSRDFALREAGVTGLYGGQPTEAARQYDQNLLYKREKDENDLAYRRLKDELDRQYNIWRRTGYASPYIASLLGR